MKIFIKLIFILIMNLSGIAMTNELKYEDSPYLKQHSNNPVNWIAWNNKAFLKAKNENKLIFLSIGYSTCHWCHVMGKESFEDKEIAKILNNNYISIKVDREEMPDVDKYYQDMHYLIQKRAGGWPLTVILLPNQKVIYAATYLPKETRGNFIGLKNILNSFIQRFKTSPEKLQENGDYIENIYLNHQNNKEEPVKIHFTIIDDLVNNIEKNFEERYKGIGNGPKFPHASTFDVLLDIYSVTKNKKALDLSQQTLTAMANGGINDQIEGGFFRYSVDIQWQIPHFEKMLYTNAELISAYSKAYTITKNKRYKEVVKNTIEAMNERFLQKELYFSASNADSKGEEGKYFVFEYEEAKNALLQGGIEKENSEEILEYLNISEFGNFDEGRTNPYITEKKAPKNLQTAKNLLKKLRSKIEYPFIDNKILTSWNALFIYSLFQAGESIDKKYKKMAFNSLNKLLDTNYLDNQLYHQYIFGSKLKVKALLEDYAFLAQALLKAYEISENKKYLDLAKTFILTAKDNFYRNNKWYLGYFKSTAQLEDSAYKSAVATLFDSMLNLSLFTSDIKIYSDLQSMLEEYSSSLKKYPHIYPSGIYLWLKMEKEPILLKVPKGTKEDIKNRLKEFNYPFLYLLSHDYHKYQACLLNLCFANDSNFEIVLEKIKNIIDK